MSKEEYPLLGPVYSARNVVSICPDRSMCSFTVPRAATENRTYDKFPKSRTTMFAHNGRVFTHFEHGNERAAHTMATKLGYKRRRARRYILLRARI